MTFTKPVFMGKFRVMKASTALEPSAEDRYLDIVGDLATGETVSAVACAVTNSAGEAVAGVISNTSISGTRVDFRVTAPTTAGQYTLSALFTISDGQSIPREAIILVV